MKKIQKNWVYKKASSELVEAISGNLNISNLVATVLVNRGVASVKDALVFLYPELTDLSSPFLLPDIIPAVERIRKAIDGKEKILIYGDRDVDGVTSISIMKRTLNSLGADPLWYIPSDEGYGVHNEIIDRYAKQGVSLIITVDCGITAEKEVEYGASLGIDFVITDHHEQNLYPLPKAVAVVNPKRLDSTYTFSELAGCTVSLKVAEALMSSFGKYFNEELIVLGTNSQVNRNTGISAIKIKNGLIYEKLLLNDGNPLDKLTLFIGQRRLVVYDVNFIFIKLRSLGLNIVNPYIDILNLSAQYFTNPPNSIIDLAKLVKVEMQPSVDGSLLLAQIFIKFMYLTDIRMNFFLESHLDLVTLGTIADIMPLINENRVLVKHGLKKLSQSSKVGVRVLMEKCLNKNKGSDLSAKDISWNITPLLNAAGRRGKADIACELLLTEDDFHAYKLLNSIDQLNCERKELQAENADKFVPLLKEQCDIDNDKIFIVTASGMEHGVTGIIASQIARKYNRPTILLIIGEENAVGAGRSIKGFDIVSALGNVSDLMIKYGGHSQAAGLTIAVNKIDEFRIRIKEIANKNLPDHLLTPTLEIDAHLQPSEINLKLIRELAEMEPFGMGNSHPVFSLKGVRVIECKKMGANGGHLKLRIGKTSTTGIDAVGWDIGFMSDEIEKCALVDMVVQLEINSWQSQKTIQLQILDIIPIETAGSSKSKSSSELEVHSSQ